MLQMFSVSTVHFSEKYFESIQGQPIMLPKKECKMIPWIINWTMLYSRKEQELYMQNIWPMKNKYQGTPDHFAFKW